MSGGFILIVDQSDFAIFSRSEFSVRRRFTDFVFLYKTLCREFPESIVPPLPDKHKMEYVRGDRFGPEFTNRRARSLHRFIKRLTLHPVLRHQTIFMTFLETTDWNSTMRVGRQQRGTSVSDQNNGGVFDNLTDTFLNAFSKVHKPDKRFIEVREKAVKLDEDLNLVEKVTARVTRRQADLEADYSDLAMQFQKLVSMEPRVETPLISFASSLETMSQAFRALKEHTDQDYLCSLRDMEAYVVSMRALLKAREQKQLDFEGLTDYLTKAASDRDTLASHSGSSGLGASGFLRSKIEDVRGVDHEQSRRDRLRKLELQIERLTREVDGAKVTSELFDEQTVKEVADFDRIKAAEFKDTLGDVAEAHISFFKGTIETWGKFITDMEKPEPSSAQA